MPTASSLAVQSVTDAFARRNELIDGFFARESHALALTCREMSERFLKNGRLLAFGKGPYATDAQHVSVEFVHPVIVGKRALPATDISGLFLPYLRSVLLPEDMVMGFAPPEGDNDIDAALDEADAAGAMTLALAGRKGSYVLSSPTTGPFEHQELVEIIYHTLWETVHVFFEHRELGQDAGEAAFLYPFLGQKKQETEPLVDQVASSIRAKAADDARLRTAAAQTEAENMVRAAAAIAGRVRQGGKLITFGNGGSATDANDFAIDCVAPPGRLRPVPALSLACEPANISAIANDVGTDVVFVRQLIAHARPQDVAFGISTSGGSRNVVAALEAARKQGLLTVALLGCDGGEIGRRKLADHALVVRSDYIPRIQEVQASMYHTIRVLMERGVDGSV